MCNALKYTESGDYLKGCQKKTLNNLNSVLKVTILREHNQICCFILFNGVTRNKLVLPYTVWIKTNFVPKLAGKAACIYTL